jgi:hypothetical protein
MKDTRKYNKKYVDLSLKDISLLESFIRGSMLGDGSVQFSSKLSKNANIVFAHGLKQKDYLQWKNSFLEKFELSGKVREYSHFSNRYKEGKCTTVFVKSKTHPIFSKFRNLYYKDRKSICKEDIWNLDEFALAIWFMDDGHLWRRKKRSDVYVLNTQSFSLEDKQILQKVLLEKFYIKTSILKTDGEIRVALESMPIFYKLIKPYILDSFKYKLNWVHVKLGEFGGQP